METSFIVFHNNKRQNTFLFEELQNVLPAEDLKVCAFFEL